VRLCPQLMMTEDDGISPRHFKRRFKSATGALPSDT
jgi:transcriptional regulator GlxA family with amidase domain